MPRPFELHSTPTLFNGSGHKRSSVGRALLAVKSAAKLLDLGISLGQVRPQTVELGLHGLSTAR